MNLSDFWKGLFGGDQIAADIPVDEGLPASWNAGAGDVATPSGFQLPSPVALGLQVGGALVKGSAAEDAARRKMALAKAMGQYKLANAGQQTGIVDKYVGGDTPQARADATMRATDEAKLGLEQSVGAAQAFAKPGEVAGNTSQAFKDAGAASADAVSARNNKLIAALSTMRAPGLVNAENARRYGLAAGEVGGLKTAANTVGGAYETDMGNVVTNPWAGMTGDVLSGVGKGIAMNDAAAKNAAALKKALA